MELCNNGILVHGLTGQKYTVQYLAVSRKTKPVLDDGFLQSAGIVINLYNNPEGFFVRPETTSLLRNESLANLRRGTDTY